MAFFHHSTFVIAFAIRMGEHKLSYLLAYLLLPWWYRLQSNMPTKYSNFEYSETSVAEYSNSIFPKNPSPQYNS